MTEKLFYELLVDIQVRSEKAAQNMQDLQNRVEQTESALGKKLPSSVSASDASLGKLALGIAAATQVLSKLFNTIGAGLQRFKTFISDSVAVAARVREMTMVLQMMGARMGYSAEQMGQLVQGVKAMGVTTAVAQQSIAQFIRYEIDMGKASELARVAQDAAVISMSNSSETLDHLIQAITTGNTRMARTAGLMVNFGQAFDAAAKSMGKSTTELTAQERVNAALNAVLEEGVRIQGAYETAMGSAGKQARSQARYIEELKENVGTALYDAYAAVVSISADFVKSLRDATAQGGDLYPALERISEAIEVLAPMAISLASTLIDGLIPALGEVLGGLMSLVKGFMDLSAPVQAAIGAFVAALPLLASLSTVIPAVTTAVLALKGAFLLLTGPVGIAAVAIGVLAGALVKLKQYSDEQRAAAQKAQEAFEQEKSVLLETSKTAEQYAQKVLQLSEAHGGVIQTTQEFYNAETGVMEVLDREAEVVAGLRDEYARYQAVHEGTTNIAEAGLKRLGEKLGEADAAARKFGDTATELPPVLEETGEALEEVAETTEDFSKEFASTWESAFQGVESTMTSHYQKLADLANNNKLDMLRAEAEYNAQRTQLVAAGKDKEVAELDRGHEKAQILRELDYKIAVKTEQAKYKAELDEQMKAFGKKMALWVAEGVAKGDIQASTGSAILAGLKAVLGNEIVAEADAALKIMDIASSKADGVAGAQQSIDLSIQQTILNYKAEAEAAAAAAAAAGGEPYSGLEGDIKKAFDRIAQITADGWDDVGEETGKGAQKVEKRAEEVTADIASTLDRLFKGIASIMETLSQQLPSIPESTVGKWLDQLYSLGKQVGTWMVSPEQAGLGEFTHWFGQTMGPMLQDWQDGMQTVAGLLGILRDITELTSTELAEVQVSLATMLDYLLALTREAGGWVNRHNQDLPSLVEWFARDLTPILARWNTAMEPLRDLLDLARGGLEILSNRIQPLRTSVSQFLDELLGITEEGYSWVSAHMPTIHLMVLLWEQLLPILERWVDSLAPLSSLLNLAKGILDITAKAAQDAKVSTTSLLDALLEITQTAYWWFAAHMPTVSLFVVLWEVLTPWLSRWHTALQPLESLLKLVKGVLDTNATEIEEVKTTTTEFLEKLLELSKVSYWWLVARWPEISLYILLWEQLTPWMTRWVAALTPLQQALALVRSMLDLTEQKLGPVKTSVATLLEQLRLILVTTLAALQQEDWQAVLVQITAEVQQVLADLNTAVGNLAGAIQSAGQMLSTLGSYEGGFSFASLINFERDIRRVLQRMLALAQEFDAEAVKLGGQWGEAVGKLMDGIASAFEVFEQLAGYQKASAWDVAQFQTDLAMLLNKLYAVQEWFVRQGMAIEQEFADGVKSIVSAASDALEFFALLATKELGTPRIRIEEFADRLRDFVSAFNRAMQEAADEGVDFSAIEEMGRQIQPAFEVLDTGLAIVIGLVGQAMPDISLIHTFVQRIGEMVTEFGNLAIEQSTLDQIDDTADSLSTAADLAQDFLAAFGDLVTMAMPTPGRIAEFAERIKQMATKLAEIPTETADKVQALQPVLQAIIDLDPLLNLLQRITDERMPQLYEIQTFMGRVQDTIAALAALDIPSGTAGLAELLRGVATALQEFAAALMDLSGVEVTPEGLGLTAIVEAVNQVIAEVKEASLFSAGENLVDSLIAGIDSRISALMAKLQELSDMLPHSPAASGPLSEPVRGYSLGYGFIDDIAQGIRNAMPSVDAALVQLSNRFSEVSSGDLFGYTRAGVGGIGRAVFLYLDETLEAMVEFLTKWIDTFLDRRMPALSTVSLRIEEIMSGLQATFEFMRNLSEYATDPQLKAKTLQYLEDLREVLSTLMQLNQWATPQLGQLNQMKAWAERAGVLIESLGDVFTLFEKMAAYGGYGPGLTSDIVSFITNVALIVEMIYQMFADRFMYQIDRVVAWSMGLGEVATGLMGAFEFIKLFSEYTPVPDALERAKSLAEDLLALVYYMSQAAEVWSATSVYGAASWAEQVGRMLSSLGGAFEVLSNLAEYTGISGILERVSAFAEDLVVVVNRLTELGASLDLVGLAGTEEWSRTVGNLLSGLRAAFSFLVSLGEYVPTTGTGAKIASFMQDIQHIVPALIEVALQLGQAGLETSATWAEGTGRLLSGLQSAFGFLTALGEYVPKTDFLAKFQEFLLRLQSLYPLLLEAGQFFSQEGLETAVAWSEGAGKLFSGIRSAFTFLQDLAEYVPDTDFMAKFGAFLERLEQLYPLLLEAGRFFAQEGLEAAVAWSEGAGRLFSGVRNVFNFLTELADYTPATDYLAKFQGFLERLQHLYPLLLEAGRFFAQEGLETAVAWSEGAGRLFSGIRSAFTFLIDLAEYVPSARNITSLLITFLGELQGTYPLLLEAGRFFSQEGLETAIAWSDGAGRLFSGIRSAFTFLLDLAEYVPSSRNVTSLLTTFLGELQRTYPLLLEAGRFFSQEGLETAVAWSEGAGQLFSGIRSAFGFLVDLAEYIPSAKNVTSLLLTFLADIQRAYPLLLEAGQFFSREGLDIAIAWSEGAGQLFSGIRSAFTFLADLAEYTAVSDAAERVRLLVLDISATFPALRDAGLFLGREGLDVATAWSEGASQLFSGVRSAFEFLKDLTEYLPVTNVRQQIALLVSDILVVFPALRDAAQGMGTAGLELGTEWAEAAGDMLGGLRNVFDFFVKLAEYTSLTNIEELVADLIRDLRVALLRLQSMAAEFAESSLEAAAKWAQAVGDLVSGVGRALEPLTQLADYSGGITEQVAQQFAEDLKLLLRKMSEVQEWFVREGLVAAEEFSERVRNLVAVASSGLDILGKLSEVTFHVNRTKIEEFARTLSQILVALNDAFRRMLAAGIDPSEFVQIEELVPAFGVIEPALAVAKGLVGQAMPDARIVDGFVRLITYMIQRMSEIEVDATAVQRIESMAEVFEIIGRAIDSFIGFFDRIALGSQHAKIPSQNTVRGIIDVIRWTIQQLMLGPTGLATLAEAHPEWANVGQWLDTLGLGLQSFLTSIHTLVSIGLGDLKGVVLTSIPQILGAFDSLITELSSRSLASIGSGLVNSLAAGIRSALPELDAALAEIAARIPASPAQKGPLAGLPTGDIARDVILPMAARVEAATQRLEAALPQAPAPSLRWGDLATLALAPQPIGRAPVGYGGGEVSNVNVSVNVPFTGAVSVRNRRDVQDIGAIVDQHIAAALPKIKDAVSSGIGRDADRRRRYGSKA